MRVTKNKTKNGLSFYIIRSVDGGSTEVVEKLGTEKEIVEKYHCKDAEAWARERARKLTENEKESREKVLVPFCPHVLLDMDQKQSFQIGYLFLQQIYYDLKLPLICNAIAKRHAFQYDMNEILSRLVYGRILFPSSKLSTYKQSSSLFEKSSFSYHDIPRAISTAVKFSQERPVFFTMTAQISISRSRRKADYADTAKARKTAPIPSYRWDSLWIIPVFPLQ